MTNSMQLRPVDVWQEDTTGICLPLYAAIVVHLSACIASQNQLFVTVEQWVL